MDIGALIKDQYVVVEHIGRGGMADVWSARDQRLRRLVAIKTIAHGLSPDVDPVQLFQKEAETIARMEHPHILPIYDFGEFSGSLYIVMRFVTGGSLEDLLRGGPMLTGDALKMGEAIGQALDYAHANSVIHLDLKPPNILLDSSNAPYLADFGLATVLDRQGRARNPGSGTLLYMAPEQLTAELIDHRADIYSFCIMLFHMFTGKLPFDGTMPLALRQMQYGDNLPEVQELNPLLPVALSDALRLGTSAAPDERPPTHAEVMARVRDALHQGKAAELRSISGSADEIGDMDAFALQTERAAQFADPGLLEAIDIYSRARHAWAGGQGRFLLGVTHFMLMSDYYLQADFYGLEIDNAGYQMLLRGALEYDYEIDTWWNKLEDSSHRWVALHALRSGNAPARIRALYRLETLPDDERNPSIPRLVGQSLEIERDAEARIAALRVLGTRARLMKPRSKFQVQTQYQARLLTSMTRLGIQVAPPAEWQEPVYSPEIDLLLGETALDIAEPRVAEFAARTIGRMRSLTAVRHLAHEQRAKRPGALQALALVRDEARALPDVVSRQARVYAWLANTLRRLFERPIDGIFRFVLVLIGAWIGMGEQVYVLFRSQALFTAQRWGNAIAIGLVFALLVALMAYFADEVSRRLSGFWHWWVRLLLSLTLGVALGTLTWSAYTWLYFNYIPQWDIMRLGGVGLAFGFIAAAMLNLRSWQAVLITTASAFAPILLLALSFYQSKTTSVFAVAPLGLAFGWLSGLIASQRTPVKSQLHIAATPIRQILAGAGLGFAWGLLTWLFFAVVFRGHLDQNFITWDGVLGIFIGATIVGLAIAYLFVDRSRWAFFALALVTFFGLYAYFGWRFTILMVQVPEIMAFKRFWLAWPYYVGVPFAPPPSGSLVYFDSAADIARVFTVSLPMTLMIALGGHFSSLVQGWLTFIGQPQRQIARDAWLAGSLVLALAGGLMVSLLALFSAHVSVPWALFWSFWGFVTFVFALAAWRWALWGARGLVVCALVLALGGFAVDLFEIGRAQQQGLPAALLQPASSAVWIPWAIAVAVGVIAVLRRYLWGAIVLAAAAVLWIPFAMFSGVVGSVAVFTTACAAVVLYGLQSQWQDMEPGRLRLAEVLPARAADTVPAPPHFEPYPTPEGMPAIAFSTDEMLKLNTQPLAISTRETPAVAPEMATELDARAALPELDTAPAEAGRTELDLSAALEGDRITLDLDLGDLPRRKTDATELDAARKEPSIKLDLGVPLKETDGEPGTSTESRRGTSVKFDLGGPKKTDGEPGSSTEPKRPGTSIKLDVNPVKKTDSEPGTGTEPKRPGTSIKLDTSAVKKGDEEIGSSTESRRPAFSIKLDLGESKPSAAQHTQLDARATFQKAQAGKEATEQPAAAEDDAPDAPPSESASDAPPDDPEDDRPN